MVGVSVPTANRRQTPSVLATVRPGIDREQLRATLIDLRYGVVNVRSERRARERCSAYQVWVSESLR